MDSYDNDLMLLLFLDDDLFFVCLEDKLDETEKAMDDVGRIQSESSGKARR